MSAARTIGRYEVVRELGRGGMGVVYEVHDPQSGARLALKLILLEADAEALVRSAARPSSWRACRTRTSSVCARSSARARGRSSSPT